MGQQHHPQKPKDDSSLAGRLLLAMPQLGDTRFHRAVIYVCAHDENGAMGLIINHELPGIDLSALLAQLNIERPACDSGATNLPAAFSAPVLNGGPVETTRGFILHSNDFTQSETVSITSDISVTGTLDALKAIATGEGPQQMLFMLGYAGWDAGQLESEIQDNAWLVADPDTALIFDGNLDGKWELAVKSLGFDPAMLSSTAGRA